MASATAVQPKDFTYRYDPTIRAIFIISSSILRVLRHPSSVRADEASTSNVPVSRSISARRPKAAAERRSSDTGKGTSFAFRDKAAAIARINCGVVYTA